MWKSRTKQQKLSTLPHRQALPTPGLKWKRAVLPFKSGMSSSRELLLSAAPNVTSALTPGSGVSRVLLCALRTSPPPPFLSPLFRGSNPRAHYRAPPRAVLLFSGPAVILPNQDWTSARHNW